MTRPKLSDLREIIIQDLTGAYQANDQAHQVKHFAAVEKCGHHINDTLLLGYDPKLIMMVAYFHDMFAWSRNNHHNLSAQWVRTTDHYLVQYLDPVARELVAIGCEEHRASRTDPFTHRFGELMNAADREMPGDVQAMLERAIQYRIGQGNSREESIKPAIIHIKEKFGEGGYARYPKLYLDAFGDQLKAQREDIMNL